MLLQPRDQGVNHAAGILWVGIDISRNIRPHSPQSRLQNIELIAAYSLKQLPQI